MRQKLVLGAFIASVVTLAACGRVQQLKEKAKDVAQQKKAEHDSNKPLVSGQIISRTGRTRVFPRVGSALLVVGLMLLSTTSADTSLVVIDLFMLVLGVGLGNCMQPLLLIMQSAVPPSEIGVATSSATFFRQIGGTLGVAVFLSILFSTVGANIREELAKAAKTDAFQQAAQHPNAADQAVLGSTGGAADQVQDAWVDIWKGLRRLDDVAAFPAWAFRIVTRRCQRSWAAAGQAHADLLDIADTPHDSDGAAAADAMARDADLARVQAAMATLPLTQRAALSLFHLEDLSVEEIAIALDVPPGTVKTRLMHARRKLRARLEGVPHEQDR